MKQSQDLKAIKDLMRNYRYYKSRVQSLNELIELCYDWLGGVRGIDLTRIHTATPPNKENEYRLRDEIERHERNKARSQAKVDEVDEILELLENDVKKAVIDVYINGRTAVRVADEYHLSPSALFKRMNKALKKALE